MAEDKAREGRSLHPLVVMVLWVLLMLLITGWISWIVRDHGCSRDCAALSKVTGFHYEERGLGYECWCLDPAKGESKRLW